MIQRELPVTGRIVLQSNISDWEPLIFGDLSELVIKGFVIKPKEKIEINILIEKVYPPGSVLTDSEIWVSNIARDEDMSRAIKYSLEALIGFLEDKTWIFEAYFLNGGLKIPMYLIHFSKINKTFYFVDKLKEKNFLFPEN